MARIVGIVVVIGFIGMMAAIGIPRFLTSPDRGHQKRTLADLRSIGAGMEAFARDNNHYPGPTDGLVPITVLEEELAPDYIHRIPAMDGWGYPFLVNSTGEDYFIVSPARDGITESPMGSDGPTQNPDRDIIFGNGSFVQWPEGMPAN